jgi:hypothetical protein
MPDHPGDVVAEIIPAERTVGVSAVPMTAQFNRDHLAVSRKLRGQRVGRAGQTVICTTGRGRPAWIGSWEGKSKPRTFGIKALDLPNGVRSTPSSVTVARRRC